MRKVNKTETDNKEWNPRDWQGRSRKSVENNYKIMDITFKVIAVSFILWSIYQVTINII